MSISTPRVVLIFILQLLFISFNSQAFADDAVANQSDVSKSNANVATKKRVQQHSVADEKRL